MINKITAYIQIEINGGKIENPTKIWKKLPLPPPKKNSEIKIKNGGGASPPPKKFFFYFSFKI